MNGTFAYSGINTKIHGMKSKLITMREYKEIACMSSVPEVMRYLQGTNGYKNLFPESADDDFYHRENLEQLLTLSMYENYSSIYTFATISQRKFLDMYFVHYETRLIKQLLRKTMNKRPLTVDYTTLQPYFDRFSDIPVQKCFQAETTEDLISSLSGTRYYKTLEAVNAMPEKNLFDYEISLDLYLFKTLWKEKNKYLKGEDLQIVTDMYGYKIDLLNLQWIYRCKKYYRMTPAEIYNMVIPVRHKLKAVQIHAMVESDSVKNFLDVLSDTFYGGNLSELDNISIEKYYNRKIYKLYTSAFRKHPYSLACIMTYLYLQEQEIQLLTQITEGVRYSYPPEDIIKLINNGGDYH